MSPEPSNAIRRRDEILQVMYWMRGEGLADAAGPAEVGVLLVDDAAAVLAADMADLAAAGLLEAADTGRYRLTATGRVEAGRRFHEDFQELMHPGHGACSDPDCDCHTLGPEACAHAHA